MVNCAMQHFFTLSTCDMVKSDKSNKMRETVTVSTKLHETPYDLVQLVILVVGVNLFKTPFFKKKAFFETSKN
jgi:hypothetical protein